MGSVLLMTFLSFATPKTVPAVDLIRYQGAWHELAALPAPFQAECYKNTKAIYTLLRGNFVEVVNSCETEKGSVQVAEGRARINPDFNEPGKLEVTFVHAFKWLWTFAGDYWILDLGDEYDYAIIGHPSLNYAWVLSREMKQDKDFYIKAEKVLADNGYDTCAVLVSRNEAQVFNERPRLCDFAKHFVELSGKVAGD